VNLAFAEAKGISDGILVLPVVHQHLINELYLTNIKCDVLSHLNIIL